MTTHVTVAASALVPKSLSEAASNIGELQVRNRGTIEGNISHANPGSILLTALTAHDAKIPTVGH